VLTLNKLIKVHDDMELKQFYKKTYKSLFILMITVTVTVILVEFFIRFLTPSPFQLSTLRIVILLIFIIAELYLIFVRPVSKYLAAKQPDEETLKLREETYHKLLHEMNEGFSLQEVIFDKDGKPVDYRFLETNKEFEKQTGLRDVKGKLRSEIGIEPDQNWINIYGRVALTGTPEHIENKGKASGRFFDAHIYRTGNS